ncbi:hypothetical protein [Methylacidiphilum caldifontis]|uniref:PA domain-containing protein n=1 Tax=Methylacidiphilum caldifontis TaxID=2795386 RepID=A0A4Y8PA46_9BACT|nr:hypothetical protein [Methylacidiphilum caldifontis]QSR89595.1 hypothetical protein IT6_04840 [Methylacidiphilum caldifontis]TFE67574.1 hypothetical protein A7Q10_09370 [Methylacidiphilum caldifontis]
MLKSREIKSSCYIFLFCLAFCSPILAKTEYFPSPKPERHAPATTKVKPQTITLVVDGAKIPVEVWIDSAPSYPYYILGLIETNRQRKHAARVAVEHGATGIILIKRSEIPYVPRWVGRHRGTLRFSEFRYWWAIKK